MEQEHIQCAIEYIESNLKYELNNTKLQGIPSITLFDCSVSAFTLRLLTTYANEEFPK